MPISENGVTSAGQSYYGFVSVTRARYAGAG